MQSREQKKNAQTTIANETFMKNVLEIKQENIRNTT